MTMDYVPFFTQIRNILFYNDDPQHRSSESTHKWTTMELQEIYKAKVSIWWTDND